MSDITYFLGVGSIILQQQFSRPIKYWLDLERIVAAKVHSAFRGDQTARGPMIMYLRGLEGMVRTECDRRETIQVIASGRRLLGDKSNTDSAGDTFSRVAMVPVP